MKKLIFILLLALGLWFFFLRDDSVTLGSGIKASGDPKQVSIRSGETFLVKGYTITPLARFSIQAKVLSKKSYYFGREAQLSPIDLALGWGKMSDEEVLEPIKIWQSSRWYRWRTETLPIPKREIEMHSANMHIVPASKEVKAQLRRIKRGDIVKFSGKLIKVKAEDGWHWASSMGRNDTGAHACELVWVEDFEIIKF